MNDFTISQITHIIREMSDENYLWAKTLSSIDRIEFSKEVLSLGVDFSSVSPNLKINLDFVNKHCRRENENDVKALVMHELLHIILNHNPYLHKISPTSDGNKCPPKELPPPIKHLVNNIAFDAVINALIHRRFGKNYSSFMSHFYKNPPHPILKILRPPSLLEDMSGLPDGFDALWEDLYRGNVNADEIKNFLIDLIQLKELRLDASMIFGALLGTHYAEGRDVTLKNGLNMEKIWGRPGLSGVGSGDIFSEYDSVKGTKDRWESKTRRIIMKMLDTDCHGGAMTSRSSESIFPIINPSDRKSFVKSLWSDFLVYYRWEMTSKKKDGAANIYLDVSGSMDRYLPGIIKVLMRLRHLIREPLWTFSTKVSKAKIENGRVKISTTGGTSLRCVLEHIIAEKPRTALIFTDGFVEVVDKLIVRKAFARTKIFAGIIPGGRRQALSEMGFKCEMLDGMD